MSSNTAASESAPHVDSPPLWRQDSAENAEQSDSILDAIEAGDHDRLRDLLRDLANEGKLDKIILAPSTSVARRMRTPLMAAADTGDLPLFNTVAHAVDWTIGRQPLASSTDLMRNQLRFADDSGLTVVMLAARSESVGILKDVVQRVRNAEVPERLLDRDYDSKTVLMHAAVAGGSAVFSTVIGEMGESWLDGKVAEEQLQKTSGDGRTILMHAARCGDQRGVRAVTHACKKFLHPRELRLLVKAVDDEGMTFLMHAAAGCSRPNGQPPIPGDAGNDDGAAGDEAELGEAGRSAGATGVAVAGKDPGLVVFKTAWALLTASLWKEQVREQLKAKDAWGRSILTHAVLSGRVAIFDAVFYAAREKILDDEVNVLLGIDKEDDAETVMEEALAGATKAMASRVARRDQELKKAVALHEKASTIEAKVQSFIPGKLIVMFQLLLPEFGTSGNKSFLLLVVMSAIAPILSWASSLVAREMSSSNEKRRSLVSLFLSAPAMFFWGMGTSSIAQDTNLINWPKSASATALAVATIVIPAVDAFFASKKIEQIYDRAHAAWTREQEKKKPRGQQQQEGQQRPEEEQQQQQQRDSKKPRTPARMPTPVRVMPHYTEDGEGGPSSRTAGAKDDKGGEGEKREEREEKQSGPNDGDG